MTDADRSAPPTLPSQYSPAEVEGPLYERWVERGYFTADPSSGKPHFSLVIPPPNVTGSLHIGHALEQSMMDSITRRKRMQGFDSLWLPGMDAASIAVQNLVERQLAEEEGKSRFDLTREQFLERSWAWKNEYGGKILGQMRRLGDGVDWSRERFTMDEGLSRAVQTIFKRLYDDDLIYRAERIINWCPRDLTALSDAEVDHADEPGELVSIRYGDGDESIVVATTRAETMLGDTAVAVHPDDARYRHLVGRHGTADQIALDFVATDLAQIFELVGRLDAFGDHADPQVTRQGDHRLHDRGAVRLHQHVADEGLVDLDAAEG